MVETTAVHCLLGMRLREINLRRSRGSIKETGLTRASTCLSRRLVQITIASGALAGSDVALFVFPTYLHSSF